MEDPTPEDVQRLSVQYRAGEWTLDGATAAAYLAVRLPATQAVVHRVMEEVPAGGNSLLDFGAGPGVDLDYPHVTRVEHNPHMAAIGRERHPQDDWRTELPMEPHDLVLCSYSLGESPHFLDFLWPLARTALVIIEPGTPAGYRSILSFRQAIIERGGFVAAPCPHERACPMLQGWCHFGTKVARSRTHRLLKQGSMGWEEEKYSFVILTRREPERCARILHVPQKHGGHIKFVLCTEKGIYEQIVSRRDKHFKASKKKRWGDRLF